MFCFVCAAILLIAHDDVDGPQLFKVDPSGLCHGWKVCFVFCVCVIFDFVFFFKKHTHKNNAFDKQSNKNNICIVFLTQGAAAGEKDAEAVAALEKRLKKKQPESEDETIQVCILFYFQF